MQVKNCRFGLGLFSDRPYPEGYVIGIIEGPVTTSPSDYAIEPKPGLYIETESPWRYINHSCQSNIQLLGERVLVATRNIEANEELFLDYSSVIYDDWSMDCECNQPNCRLKIGR